MINIQEIKDSIAIPDFYDGVNDAIIKNMEIVNDTILSVIRLAENDNTINDFNDNIIFMYDFTEEQIKYIINHLNVGMYCSINYMLTLWKNNKENDIDISLLYSLVLQYSKYITIFSDYEVNNNE